MTLRSGDVPRPRIALPMPRLDEIAPHLLDALHDAYGGDKPPHYAVPDRPFPVIIACYLARAPGAKTARVLAALAEAGLLDPAEFAAVSDEELVELWRQAGLSGASRHIGPLRQLALWATKRGDSLTTAPTETLREELRGLRGIGPATADAILLFALEDRPTYPVDRATYRIFVRHGWIDPTAEYEEARAAARRLGGDNTVQLRCLSSDLERIGAEFCRVTLARCERCPLRPWLPEGGPRQPD